MLDDSVLISVALRVLRRTYTGNIDGLTTFANGLVSDTQTNQVTITQSIMEGSSGQGQITMQREIWLVAAEELLADPRFNPNAPAAIPRVVQPDYRFATAV